MAAIHIQNAVKHFGAAKVLDDVSLNIEDGELFALLGPSGCGKTTTLRAIAGLETFDKGQIHLGDKRIDQLTPGERDIAFVFQLYTLYPHLSVADNIAFPLRAASVPSAEITRRVAEVAKLLRITPLLSFKPSKLSGGDMQRVTIARALVRNPAALLMDEPLGALDAKLREDMRAELAQLHAQRRITTVLVTHDQVEAMSLADRIAVMHGGRVQQVGTAAQVYEKPANLFVAQFIGAPSMNIVDVEPTKSTDGGIALKLAGCSDLLNLHDQQQVVLRDTGKIALQLGIRPEAMTLCAPGEAGLRGEVDQYEPLGAYDLVSLRLQNAKTILRVKTKPRSYRQVGEAVTVRPNPSGCHLFDRQSGLAVA